MEGEGPRFSFNDSYSREIVGGEKITRNAEIGGSKRRWIETK
jgi:hypothetical protein